MPAQAIYQYNYFITQYFINNRILSFVEIPFNNKSRTNRYNSRY